MSYPEIHKITKLENDVVEKLKLKYPKDNLNGYAILISKNTPINMYRDLFLYSAYCLSSTIKDIESKVVINGQEINNLDSGSKNFLIGFCSFSESLFNSYSLRENNSSDEFKGFEDFDRFELKMKLQKLIDLL